MARKKNDTAALIDTTVTTKNLDDLLGFNLRRAQEASFAAFVRRVGDTHIWSGWFALLMIVNENPGINQTALSVAAGRDKSTLTTSLRQLVREGLVERQLSATDRRSYTLKLTDAGRDHLESMQVHAREHDKLLDRIVGRENKRALLMILRKIASELGSPAN